MKLNVIDMLCDVVVSTSHHDIIDIDTDSFYFLDWMKCILVSNYIFYEYRLI